MGRSWVPVVLLAGCYAPAVPSEVPCGDGDACPGGQFCDHGRPVPTCVDQLGDAGTSSDGNQVAIDAAVDAPVMPLPAGNVMRLRFDDDPTDGATDSEGSHTATCATATCPALAVGHLAGGYAFTNDHVDIADALDLRPNGGFTAAAWINPSSSSPTASTVVCKSYFTLAETYALTLQGGNARLRFTGASANLTGNTIVTLDAWHHVAMTWDGTSVRLYLDGDADGSLQQAALPSDNGEVQIGACHGNTKFAGTIDDVQFYSRALTAAEIATLASY